MHIDWWTLALQTVNVLILVWLLARFLFRPVAKMIAARQQQAEALLADAAAARQAAAAANAQAEKLRDEASAARGGIAAEAQKADLAARDALLAKARDEAVRLRADAEAAIARDRADAQAAATTHAGDLAVDIAGRLLERLPRGLALEGFLVGLGERLRSLPPDVRHALVSPAAAGPLEIVTDTPLAERDVQRVRQTIVESLGCDPALAFRSDAGVLAGIELHTRNTVVSNSWRADLARIRGELDREQQSSRA